MHGAHKDISLSRHERSDVGEGFMWWAAAAMLVMLVVCAVATWWLYPQTSLDRRIHLPLTAYPNPRLQPNPREDMERMRARELRELNGAGWVDRARGIAHIPIDAAMDKIVEEGITDWPAGPTPQPATAGPAP
jgi:hypothetical protein